MVYAPRNTYSKVPDDLYSPIYYNKRFLFFVYTGKGKEKYLTIYIEHTTPKDKNPFKGINRLESFRLPPRDTKEESILDLEKWAKKKKLSLLTKNNGETNA